MLTIEQESRLTSGGDSPDHWHSSDRQRSHSDLETLQGLTIVKSFTATGDIPYGVDIAMVDTTSASVTMALPVARSGLEIEVVKTVASNTLQIDTSGADTVFGETSVVLFEPGSALRFKAIAGGWILL